MINASTGELRPPFFAWCPVLVFILHCAACLADNPTPPGILAESPTVSNLIHLLIRDALEEEYVDERHWGMTTDRFDGVKVQGLRISKRKKEVNHGLWYRFKAHLLKPDDTLHVHVEPLDAPGPGTFGFAATIRLRARCEATFVNWSYGVKGTNGTVVSHASIALRLVLHVSPETTFSPAQLVPRLQLKTRVADVRLRLLDLDVRRVGVIGGTLAALLGDGSRSTVKALVESQERKIQQKLQAELGH